MPLLRVGTDDKRLRVYSSFTDAQLRECYTSRSGDKLGGYERFSFGLFVAESRNVIERALRGGYPLVSIFLEEKWLDHEMPLIRWVLERDPEVPVLVCGHDDFVSLTGYQVTRGALACFERKPLLSVEELCAHAKRIAILEDVTNYTNIGAIFRSAAALGVDAVLVTPKCHDPLYRRASRVSMGTVFQVPWTRIGSEGEWAVSGIDDLHRLGFTVIAMALEEESISLDDPFLASCDRLAIVLGTEGEGLASETISLCDKTVMIPMEHGVDSLNVAAASAVAFWELRKGKRR